MKVCLVGSSGGHLAHLNMLKPFWSEQDRFWVTFDKEDARSILKDEQFYPCYFPTNRNFKNLVKNNILEDLNFVDFDILRIQRKIL